MSRDGHHLLSPSASRTGASLLSSLTALRACCEVLQPGSSTPSGANPHTYPVLVQAPRKPWHTPAHNPHPQPTRWSLKDARDAYPGRQTPVLCQNPSGGPAGVLEGQMAHFPVLVRNPMGRASSIIPTPGEKSRGVRRRMGRIRLIAGKISGDAKPFDGHATMFARGGAICQVLPHSSRTMPRRSPYGRSDGSSSEVAPAWMTPRRCILSTSSTYT